MEISSVALFVVWCTRERDKHAHSYKRNKTKKAWGNTKVQDLCHHAFDDIWQSIWSFSHSWDLWRRDQIQAQGVATQREREREFSYFLCSDGCETCLLFDRTWTKLSLKFPPSQQLKTLFVSHKVQDLSEYRKSSTNLALWPQKKRVVLVYNNLMKKKKKRGEMIDLLIFQMYSTCKEGSHTRRNMSNCKREGGRGRKGDP